LRTVTGDLHRLGAVWSLPFALIIAVTSIWYFVERDAVSWETAPPVAQPLRSQPDGATIDRWVATAQSAMPGLKVTGVALPWGDGDPVVVQGEWKAWLVRERTNAAFIDPVSGKLLGLRVAHEMAGTERWVHTADPLHFGNFGGLATKLLWVLFGLALTGLAATGAVIHGKRIAGMAAAGIAGSWRAGVGWALIPTLLLIIAVPTWFYFDGWDSGSGTPRRSLGTLATGGQDYAISAAGTYWCARPLAGTPPTELSFIDSTGRPTKASFEAGSFCAELPAGQSPAGLN